MVGAWVGRSVGAFVGSLVGGSDGDWVGNSVGGSVGVLVGAAVGRTNGDWLGKYVGESVGATVVTIGVSVVGDFVGGPVGDCGLTGRKIVVDTYGGVARHGGGAFSGKDPSKVDRSAAYACRYVAKNIVAAGLAERCEVQVSYAIGVAEPTSLNVDTLGTGKIDEERIRDLVLDHFNLRPRGIIEMLDLLRPIYRQTSAYGHFGRTEPEFSWEQTNKADIIREKAGL